MSYFVFIWLSKILHSERFDRNIEENKKYEEERVLNRAEVEEKNGKEKEKTLLREEEERKKTVLLVEHVGKDDEKARLLEMEKEEKIKNMRIEAETRALARKKAKEMKRKAVNGQENFISNFEVKST